PRVRYAVQKPRALVRARRGVYNLPRPVTRPHETPDQGQQQREPDVTQLLRGLRIQVVRRQILAAEVDIRLAGTPEPMSEQRAPQGDLEVSNDAADPGFGGCGTRRIVRDDREVSPPLQIRHERESEDSANRRRRQQGRAVLAAPDDEQGQEYECQESGA